MIMKYLLLLIPFFGISQTIDIQSFGPVFTDPVDIENAGDTRLFIVEQAGNIKILNANGTVNSTPFLNISALTAAGGERGLLGLAFHPNYASNGLFFINYTNTAGNTVIAKYSVTLTGVGANPNVANTSGTILMTINQPFANHNGGSLKFGPDGYLYIGMGDGGSANDPNGYAQNLTIDPANPTRVYLGKMLRIDVNSTAGALPYGIPSTNPYVGQVGKQEIWANGLRNPWKFSFNRANGDLWIADVGQGAIEEISKVSPTLANPNFGWKCFEGNVVFSTTGNCSAIAGTIVPLTVVNHNIGSCSITGGYVYNGSQYPNLIGKYLFTDYCNPKIGVVNTTSGVVNYSQDFTGKNFVSFGENSAGELFVSDITGGNIYKVIDTAPLEVKEFNKNEFKIYPNPSKNEVYVEKSDSSYPTEVTIFDMNGKILAQQKTENIQRNTIQTGALASGLYIMNVKNNLDTTSTHKLVIE
jgi:glucose/arabinose dehydrogenase